MLLIYHRMESQRTRQCIDCGTYHERKRAPRCLQCALRASSKEYYARHRDARVKKRALHRTRTAEERKRRNARAYLAVYLRRDALRDPAHRRIPIVPCECGSADVVPYQSDPCRPLEVTWYCRQHRSERIRNEAVEAMEVHIPSPRGRIVEGHRPWAASCADAVAAIAELDSATRLALERKASASPFPGVHLDPASPIYKMQLVKCYNDWLSGTGNKRDV